MADPRVQVVIEAVDRASGTLDRVNQSLSRNLRRISAGLLIVGGAITAFGALAVKMSIDQRLAVDRTRLALELAGEATTANAERVDDLVDELVAFTSFSETDLHKAFQTLIGNFKDSSIALKSLEAAALLAEVADIGLKDSVDLIIGVLDGEKGAVQQLSNLGIVVDGNAGSFDKLTTIIMATKDRAKELQTPIDDLTDALAKLRKVVGDDLLPPLEKVVEKFTPIITALASFLEQNPAVVIAIAAIGTALLVFGTVAAIAATIAGLTAALAALGVSGAVVLGIAAIATAIAILGAGVLLLWANWDNVWGWITGRIADVSLSIHLEIEIIKSRFRLFIAWFRDFFQASWNERWDMLKDKVIEFGTWLRNTFLPQWSISWHDIGGIVGWAAKAMLQALGPIGTIILGFLRLIEWVISLGHRGGGGPPANNTPIPQPIPVPKFQHGGMTTGGLALVGEQGPELAMFPGGTRIMPAGTFGGGASITVNINGPVYGLSDLKREILETVRRAIDGGAFYQTLSRPR